MQQLVADCLDVPNLWKNKKGSSACGEVTRSFGTHYRDYVNYNNGVISFYNDGEDKNMNVLHIGHDPICPCCGETHSEDGSLCCSSCDRGTEVCEHCGDQRMMMQYSQKMVHISVAQVVLTIMVMNMCEMPVGMM